MYFNKKMLLVTILAIIIPLMAVGYASLQQKLVISGTSHVDSNWQIEIISVTESDIVGDAKDKVAPSYTGTTAKFKVSLINPTDSITYNVKIKNLGTLDARIKKLNIDIGESDAIIYDVNLVKNDGTNISLASNNQINQTNINNTKNTTLSPNEEQTVKLKVTFKEGYIGQPDENNSSNTIKMTIDYVQNFKDSNGEQIIPFESYNIGDKITFAGSDWYVIEDSSSSQDYVVLLKEMTLTATEIGSDYSTAYYWSETCHGTYTYGNVTYSSTDSSGCSEHNDYAGSKIKEVVDNYMIIYLDESKLKEVDNYKIRLITIDDLINNLDCTSNSCSTSPYSSWIYNKSVGRYWTMTPNNVSRAYYVHSNGGLSYYGVSNPTIKVRPVINLYKSAIE